VKQSISELRAENARVRQARRVRKALHFPTNILYSNDMTVILNARATVLLNMSFHCLWQQARVIELSSLALWL
jgi:hypothetical protein